MFWFLLVCTLLFVLSVISNIIFILSDAEAPKSGALAGLIVFVVMIVWSVTLMFSS
jgi:hypothetical protein